MRVVFIILCLFLFISLCEWRSCYSINLQEFETNTHIDKLELSNCYQTLHIAKKGEAC
jgi:hypothetical protein